ncbi:uncharacterized protein LOC122531306 [Frieseomelitta varia]|uniref:uncharacterized protein LOC122531306 n=1 Tax=Frieseomelitta varia TaxID=561572 RepID=UPI001CB6991E|nr:uncharacterized protein LOC122531306 [Frieseomelitta varia]
MITSFKYQFSACCSGEASVPRATESPRFGVPPFGRFITRSRPGKRGFCDPGAEQARSGTHRQEAATEDDVGKGDAVPVRRKGIKADEEADMAVKEATSPSSDVIRRRIKTYQDLVVTLHHHAEKQSWNKI